MNYYHIKDASNPAWNNTSTNKATSEEISIIPIGGIIFLNGSKMVHIIYQVFHRT